MTSLSIKLSKALILLIGNLEQPVITDYQLGVLLFHFYGSKEYDNKKISRLSKAFPDKSDYNRIVSRLSELNIITKTKTSNVYNIIGKKINLLSVE